MTFTLALLTTSIGKKYLSAASGFCLGLFLVFHLAGNATTVFGRAAYNAYAAHLHALGPFLTVPETALALVLLLHVGTGLFLFCENLFARPSRYAVRAPLTTGVNSATMPYTGLIILVYAIVHLAQFHFAQGTTPIADLVKATLSQPAVGLFYLVALAALGLHVSHGFWSLLQTFGINHPRYNTLLVRSGLGGGIAISAAFMTIVLLALFSPAFLG